MTDPEYMKKHQTLAIVLSAIIGLVTTAFAGYAGYKSFQIKQSTLNISGGVFGGLARAAGRIIKTSLIVQGVGACGEAAIAGVHASYLKKLADDLKDLGQFQGLLQEYLAGAGMNQFTTKTNDSAASNITKAVADEMAALEQSSGLVWAATDQSMR